MNEAQYKIPLLDLKLQYREIAAEIQRAIDEILTSQQFILGPAVKQFEEQIASYLQCKAAIGVASGSDALLVSLMALGIGPGDAVLVPTFTFFSTVSAVVRVGARPILVDINPTTYVMDIKDVETSLAERFKIDGDGNGVTDPKSDSRVRAILPVHLFGQCCPMQQIVSLAEKYGFHIIEDVAQAFGSRAWLAPGVTRAAGTIGRTGCFSFFPTKILGGIGDGGLIATSHIALAEKIRMLRVHGQDASYHHRALGINSRLDEIQAAVLGVKLRHIDRWCEERIARARFYRELFSATSLIGDRIFTLPEEGEGKSHVFNQFVLRVYDRNNLKSYLEKHGIQTAIYYPVPLHLQPSFAYLGHRKGDFPKAEMACDQVLALPMHPGLTQQQQQIVVEKINQFFLR